jgi:ATP-dependent exoDNAse (exonuclease V) beta subunit
VLAVFWIAILVIDFCYNNRLLIGAVAAIRLLPPGHSPRVLTGHIDFLQVRNGAVHILDYKPDARTNKPIAQLTLYALALTRLAGLRLFDIKCAWFNEEQYCEFFPRALLARQN